jgi:HD-GYP domain-containing protein (c-di-GMP phosphodiesterase class II)
MPKNSTDASDSTTARGSPKKEKQDDQSGGVVLRWPQKPSSSSRLPSENVPLEDENPPCTSIDDEISLYTSFLDKEGEADASDALAQWSQELSSDSPDESPDESADLPEEEEIPRGFSPQPPPGLQSAAHDMPGLLFKPPVQKLGLRDELPEAIRAYDLVHSTIWKHFPALSIKKTLELTPLEYAVSNLIASLERNLDALLCLALARRPKVDIYSHAINVSIYAAAYALHYGRSYSEAVATGLAGLLHDAGMTLLPLALLRSSQQLSATEQVLVKRHPIIAYEVFSGMSNMHSEILSAVLEHHEHYDGSGYPAGSSGSRISFIGHLMAIASSFDAMTSPRRHKAPISAHTALGKMFKRKNAQFHPGILEDFIQMIGIYPVGSAVILEDGYCGIVSARTDNPARPVITLILDSKGDAISPLELDMSKEPGVRIVQCGSPGEKGIDIREFLGIPDTVPLVAGRSQGSADS